MARSIECLILNRNEDNMFNRQYTILFPGGWRTCSSKTYY